VTKIDASKTPSFDEAKQQLKDELIQEAEADRLDKIANQIDDALAGGTPLADVAAKYHLHVATVPASDASGPDPAPQPPTPHVAPAAASDASGRDPDGKPVTIPVAQQDVLKLAFDTGENANSRVNATEDGTIFVVHVDKVTPPQTRPLADVKDQAAAAWTVE